MYYLKKCLQFILKNKEVLLYSVFLFLGISFFFLSPYTPYEIFYGNEDSGVFWVLFAFALAGISSIFILPYYFLPYKNVYPRFLKILIIALYPIVIIILNMSLTENPLDFFQTLLYIGLIGFSVTPLLIFAVIKESDASIFWANVWFVGVSLGLFLIAWLFSFVQLLFILLMLALLLAIIVYGLGIPVYLIYNLITGANIFLAIAEALPEDFSPNYNADQEPQIIDNVFSASSSSKEDTYEKYHHYYHYKTVVENTITRRYTSPVLGADCADVDYTVTFYYRTDSGSEQTDRVYGSLTAQYFPNPGLTVSEAESIHSYKIKDYYA